MSKKKKKQSGRSKAKKAGSSKKKEEELGTLDEQMEQLKIAAGENSQADDEASLLEEAIKLAAAEKEALESSGAGEKEESTRKGKGMISRWQCNHGYVSGEYHFIVDVFFVAFLSGFHAGKGLVESMEAAHKILSDKYPEIYHDSSKLKLVVSSFLSEGTHSVLVGDFSGARIYAFLAFHLQDYHAIFVDKSKVIFDEVKHIELQKADEHTLVKYLRKNIPCSCLDEKYKEVKSITKLGLCCNLECSLPNRMAERSAMLCCTGCRIANYCSRECQKAAWPGHKQKCGNVHTLIAELESME